MAEIAGVTVEWNASPRIIKIPLATREVTAQDLLDTCRALESSLDALDDLRLVDSVEGETALDDVGTLTTITLTLLNAQVYFIPNNTPKGSGTATSASTDNGRTIILTDTGATFQTDGAERGDTIFNSTTAAIATIISVDSETQLTSLPLTGGSRADWQVNDGWSVYNNEQATISGGNVVAIDDEDLRNFLSPVLEGPNVQVVRSSASSGTTSELEAIQYASYGGGVHIDPSSPTSGTTYPAGNAEFPVNNLLDALTIAQTRGFNRFFIEGNLTLTTEDASDGYVFQGASSTLTTITINAGADVTNCEFTQCMLTGTLDGGNTVTNADVSNLSFVQGSLQHCGISGTITLGGSVTAEFVNCYSKVAGVSTPTIDLGGSGQALLVRDYSGGILLQNKTGTDAISIDMASGQVRLASTITAGTIYLRGVGTLTQDDSGGTAVVVNEMLSQTSIAGSVWSSDLSTHTTTGTAGYVLRRAYNTAKWLLGLV